MIPYTPKTIGTVQAYDYTIKLPKSLVTIGWAPEVEKFLFRFEREQDDGERTQLEFSLTREAMHAVQIITSAIMMHHPEAITPDKMIEVMKLHDECKETNDE